MKIRINRQETGDNKAIARNIILVLFILSVVVVFVVLFYANMLIDFSLETMRYNIEQRLLIMSEDAAELTTAEELDQYRLPEHMSLPSYEALRYKLWEFSKKVDVKYVYYLRRAEGNKLQYIMDNVFEDRGDIVNLNTPPYESLPWIDQAFEGQTICPGLGNYTPGMEGLLTAYSPVYDKEGKVAALAGVDIWDEPIVRAQKMVRNLAVIQIIALVVVFMSGLICLISFHREAERANEASRAKSAFLAQTSHEIRTPMNAVLGMSELALRADSLLKALGYVEGIKQAGHNLLSIINDILDISKIEAGTLEVNRAPYSFSSLLNDVINIIRLRAAEKSLLFIADVDAGIPNNLFGDELRIRQILLNLLSNAVKYTDTGHIRLSVRMESSAPEPKNITLLFEVADTGIGIREKDLSHLFHRFTRLDMNKNIGIEGTGLGLAIAKSLCLAMGGDVSVTSTYGEGSVFRASFPQAYTTADPLAVVENPAAKGVLCYVKEKLYAESIAYTLKNLGVPLRLCADAEELCRELGGSPYPFAFIGEDAAENAAALVKKYRLRTELVALVKSGDLAVSGFPQKIQLPLYAVSAANVLNNRTAAEPKKRAGGQFIAPNARILVVDDIYTNLVVTEGLLESYHTQVDTCASGAEAIRMVQERRYDLVFMDHMMPGIDGIESTRHIRALEGDYYQRLPIIALTANAITGMRELFLEQGFNDYLSKPVEIAKLDTIMDTWIPADKKTPRNEGDDEEDAGHILEGITVEGLDLSMGRGRYREKTYVEVLRAYAVHTPAILEKLRALTKNPLSEETIGEYTITVHGLKGSTYGICAEGIAKQAEKLEKAARNGDLAYISRENRIFIKVVERLLEQIRRILARISAGEKAKPKADSPDPALLRELVDACKHYRANAMEAALAKLESFEYESGGGLVAWLREQADNLEYDAIVGRLEPLAGEANLEEV